VNVLFVCVANSGRSVIAEHLFRRAAAGRHEVRSAGSDPGSEAHPAVVEALAELGIDVSGHTPQKLSPELLELVPRARQLQALGTLNSSDITQRLWNLPAKGGRNWQTYVAKYDQITRYIAMVDAYMSLFFPPETDEEENQAESEAQS